MSRFLLAIIRNYGVAIAISMFFAAARGPSPLPTPGAVKTLAALEASYSESTAAAQNMSGCDRPAVRVCRLLDVEQQMPEKAP